MFDKTLFEKTYNPTKIEADIAKAWKAQKIGAPTEGGDPYCIMVPPPNVTGNLHLGHALQLSVMDTLARFKRMTGHQVLLQPGTDHAGIATQMVVERQLAEKNTDRHALGREAFTEKIWEWKAQSGHSIALQTQKLGVSVDWERERFTMDDDYSQSVQHTFIKLYEKGYIYRGKRLVNWDTVLQTAVSDLEVINTEKQGQIWYIRYPVNDQFITVATTRPETILGDMAICVHPDDTRYQSLIGHYATLTLSNRKIPIIADEYVDPEFGTGCLKITPAHDFNDYEIGLRHQLDCFNILNKDGTLNTQCPKKYQGMDRFTARKAIVKDLDELGLLEKVEPHTLSVPIGDRSNTVLEPLLTDQWFVKTDQLAKSCLEALDQKKLAFVPHNWEKNYRMWLDNIQDWCISRQIWWGHRIPAYYDEAGKVYCGESEAAVRERYQIKGTLTQDNDVLDTWFSSALWPFATLGWPEKTTRYQTFYPNSLLVTGFDIIFFWVARMCMFGDLFTQTMPFPKIFVTGLIRDEFGQKMSKSKGNVLDPIDLIEGASLEELIKKRTTGMMQPKLKAAAIKATQKSFPDGINAHGTDALRFTLLSLLGHSKDINFDLNKLRASRNFCNKIWNAARFLSQEAQQKQHESILTQALSHQIHQLILDCQTHLDDYRFDRYAQTLYDFFWNEFCDWHLEIAKVSGKLGAREARMASLYQVFDDLLKIYHPALPFITEALWKNKHGKESTLALTTLPTLQDYPQQPESYQYFMALKDLIGGIRHIRSALNIKPKSLLTLYIKKDDFNLIEKFSDEIKKLAMITEIKHADTLPQHTCQHISEHYELGLDLEGHIDPEAEKIRLNKQISKLEKEQSKVKAKVNNPNYQEKAPLTLREKDQAIIKRLDMEITKLQGYLKLFEV